MVRFSKLLSFFKEIIKSPKYEERIKLSEDNIQNFAEFNNLLQKSKVRFDSKGQLRYLHGSPVGDLVLIRVNKDGTPIYKESTEEWFDPDSPAAKEFIWP